MIGNINILSYLHIGFHPSCLHNDHSHHTANPLHLCIYLYSYIISHHCCMMDLQKESLIVRQSNEASLFYHGLKSGYMIVIPFLCLPFLMRPLSLIHGSRWLNRQRPNRGGKARNCIHVIDLAWACNGYHTSTCICMECILLLTELWRPVFHWQWDSWKGRYLYAKLMRKALKPNTLI